MDYHYHARLVVHSREQLARSVLEGRLSLKEAAASFKLSRQSAAKWVGRYRDQGVAGLNDRSSRPHRSPRGTSEERIMEIEQLRRQRWTGVRIALELGLSQATISRVLRRLKQSDAFEWFWNRVVVSSQGDVFDYGGTGISDNDTKYPRR